MSLTPVFREYNPTTGNLIGTVNALQFGNVNVGEFSGVKVLDFYVYDASIISDVAITVVRSSAVSVNDSPTDVRADGTAGNGNIGIETSSTFVARNTLTRFFSGLNQAVTVGTRAGNVSKFIYLNIKMAMSSAGSGSVSWTVTFDYS